MKAARRVAIGHIAAVGVVSVGCLLVLTGLAMNPTPESLPPNRAEISKVQLLDRNGFPLLFTYQNSWNWVDQVSLHQIPSLLKDAFILSEDSRFYGHHGADWLARGHALVQTFARARRSRGASTITEQAVRMIHPRSRTAWSRWVEGFEGARLERRFPKATILEFYLNQIPYASNRRGVAQAARDYFDRDLNTLNEKELLALTVLVRAPDRLDLRKNPSRIEAPVRRLAQRLGQEGLMSDLDVVRITRQLLDMKTPVLPARAEHFARYVGHRLPETTAERRGQARTTLDSALQTRIQALLDARVRDLRSRHVTDGAVLVVENSGGEILAWVNAGEFFAPARGSQIDAVISPRQPGSTLKPFLYALAIEKGWTPATLIEDSPVSGPVGTGLHAFHNYSRQHYGPIRLREALGNSLNVPAVKTASFIGRQPFLDRLHDWGFRSLTQSAEHYGVGLVLGNGEVTLFELVQAYAALARGGVFRPLISTWEESIRDEAPRRVISDEISSMISDILSDSEARLLEFGRGNLLRFSVQTAVKTGTSSDYRDAWAIGYTNRFTAGVWMGNLNEEPTGDMTGAVGPALVLRQVFAELSVRQESEPLRLSPGLKRIQICRTTGLLPAPSCPRSTELFRGENTPTERCASNHEIAVRRSGGTPPSTNLKLKYPTDGLQLAMDPRIPDRLEVFPFLLPDSVHPAKTKWIVDDQLAGRTAADQREFLWQLSRGTHSAKAIVWFKEGSTPVETPPVEFLVK